MSYCRFSSDNWKSDVYVYDAGYAYVIHVAGKKRLIAPIPELPIWIGIKLHKFTQAKWDDSTRKFEFPSKFRQVVHKSGFWLITKINWFHNISLNLIPLVDINLPRAGETFERKEISDCIDTLEYLKKLGYNVPKSALKLLRDELTSEQMIN